MRPPVRTKVLNRGYKHFIALAAVNLGVRLEIGGKYDLFCRVALYKYSFVGVNILTNNISDPREVFVLENDVDTVEQDNGTLDDF